MEAAWIQQQCGDHNIAPMQLSDIARLSSSQKIPGVACSVEKIISEGVGDVVIRIRDSSCGLNCCFHSSVFSQYPVLAERDTVLILKDVTVMCTRRSSIGVTSTLLLCSLDNVVAIFATKGKPHHVEHQIKSFRECHAPQQLQASALNDFAESYDAVGEGLIFGDTI